MAKSESSGTIVVAIVANGGIAIAKGVVAVLTGSASMFAETVHSVVDTANEGLLLLGEHRGDLPADERHPFGYGKEVYFWSLLVAIVVFAIGGGIGMLEGIQRLVDPETLGDPRPAYVVLAIAAVLEGFSWSKAFAALRATTEARDLAGYYRAARASKDPGVFVVLYEDTAALIGVALAALGTFLAHVLHEPRYDGAASVAIGIVLAVVAVGLVVETRGLLIGESAAPATVASIRAIAAADARVRSVKRLLTMQLAPDQVLVNLDLDVREGLDEGDASGVIADVEAAIRARHPEARMIFTEIDSLPARVALARSRAGALETPAS